MREEIVEADLFYYQPLKRKLFPCGPGRNRTAISAMRMQCSTVRLRARQNPVNYSKSEELLSEDRKRVKVNPVKKDFKVKVYPG